MYLSDLIRKYMELIDLLPDDVEELDKDSYLLMRQICNCIVSLYVDAVV